ncbi:MAG: hypothetical protein WDN69_24820 [Aliidongia sp.]
MLTVDEAFRKFKSRLELNDRERKNAVARQTEVRNYLVTKFAIDRSFLTGSYARYTKTKPLKDIDHILRADGVRKKTIDLKSLPW